MVKHVLLLKAKSGKTPEEAEALFAALAGLVGKIDGLIDFAGGADITAGARSQGYTHGFVMTLTSPEAVAAYLPHPEHQKVAALVREFSSDRIVLDFECE